MDRNLKKTLDSFKDKAFQGYQQACDNNQLVLNLFQYIKEEKNKVAKVEASAVSKRPELYDSFINKTDDLLDELKDLCDRTRDSLYKQQKEYSIFDVVVYGRTKAGKSTLMEILTDGDGKHIGKGAQRTTLDIRDYVWNGLRIYDTPGIAAAAQEGRADEKKAYDIASNADMLIFMVSDDAPQKEEGNAFAEMKKLGKNIIGIINVKSSDSGMDYSRVRLFDVKRKFVNDRSRLDALKNQFLDLIASAGGRRDNITFVYTDLHTAFLSKRLSLPEEQSKELYNLSNFQEVEDVIIKEIKEKGSFCIYKSFIDITYHQLWVSSNKLMDAIKSSEEITALFTTSRNNLSGVIDKLKCNCRKSCNTFIEQLDSELKREANDFAEYNYDNKYAGDDWKQHIDNMDIDGRVRYFLEELADSVSKEVEEFAKQVQSRLSFTIRMSCGGKNGETVRDYGFAFKIATGLAAIVAAFSGFALVGMIISVVGGLISMFFTSKAEKIRRAKRKMRNALNDGIDRFIGDLRIKLDTIVAKKLFAGYLDKVKKEMDDISQNCTSFLAVQTQSATKLNEALVEMNKQMLRAALEHLHKQSEYNEIIRVGRIPGEVLLILTKDGHITDEQDFVAKMQNLLQEEVLLLAYSDDIRTIIRQLFDIDDSVFSINEENKIISIDVVKLKEDIRVKRYHGLLPQLIGYIVRIEGEFKQITDAKADKSHVEQPDVNEQPLYGLEWYDTEADFGDMMVQLDIALHYFFGDITEKDNDKAYQWALKAATEAGYPNAQCFVGDCYYFGIGVEKDYQEAFSWYAKAAAGGFGPAHKYLGDCYYFGDGVERDSKKAADCYEKSCESSYFKAYFNYGNAFFFEEGREVNQVLAASNYISGAINGDVDAQYNLACCCYFGYGIEQSYSRARYWYDIAASGGSIAAREALVLLFRRED